MLEMFKKLVKFAEINLMRVMKTTMLPRISAIMALTLTCLSLSAAPAYTVKTTPTACADPDWADKTYVITGKEVTVEVYDSELKLLDWMGGGEGYDLVLRFNGEGRVTAFAPYFDSEAEPVTASGDFASYTHNPDFYYYTVFIDADHAFARTDKKGGRVLLYGVFNGATAADKYDCYYLKWKNPSWTDDGSETGDDESSMTMVTADESASATEYYTLQGRRIAAPKDGEIVVAVRGGKGELVRRR